MTRRTLIASAAAAGVSQVAAAQTARPIVVGQVNLSFYQAASAVVVEVLARLGHATRIVEGPHSEIYDRLGRGEADLLVASWLPHAHGPLHAPLAEQLIEAATLYEDALLYWAVPSYVPAELVTSIDDLKRPEVVARMDREIVGVGPGSGLMRGSEEILVQYGLDRAGYRLSVAPQAEWAGKLADAYRERRWMVMPLWRPHHLNAVHDLRVLVEPQGVFGEDRAVLIARRSAWDALPARSRAVIGRVQLGLAAVTELDRRIVIDQLSPAAAATGWMSENREWVAQWFAD